MSTPITQLMKHRKSQVLNNSITVIIRRSGLIFIAALLLIVTALPASAQESMIPDDFDWSIYFQGTDDEWDSWGSGTQTFSGSGSGYQDPVTYDWYGQTYELNLMEPTPVPQYEATYAPGDYIQVPIYPDSSYVNEEQTGEDESDDGWFYQLDPDEYDDFLTWTGGSQDIPESAYVSGFSGYEQTYNLDCEARSAVDFAAWFGVNIDHGEFLYNLPKSDDPNVGFVGSWTDARGHIPPASYGVYQRPVAALLRNYGLSAYGAYAYTQDALKAQIAAGKPVMVWVVGNVELGYSVPYTPASTGQTTHVVPYQHTVVVVGYDGTGVTVQDGAMRYSRDWTTFLLSWGALGNRAIYVK